MCAGTGAAESHAVLRVVAGRAGAGSRPAGRNDGLHVALAIEGGGMRGTVSAGMALALMNSAWCLPSTRFTGLGRGDIRSLAARRETEGLCGWADPAFARALIRRSRLLRGRPVADVRALIEEVP